MVKLDSQLSLRDEFLLLQPLIGHFSLCRHDDTSPGIQSRTSSFKITGANTF